MIFSNGYFYYLTYISYIISLCVNSTPRSMSDYTYSLLNGTEEKELLQLGDVNCGKHKASSCVKCGNSPEKCQGDCTFLNDNCTMKEVEIILRKYELNLKKGEGKNTTLKKGEGKNTTTEGCMEMDTDYFLNDIVQLNKAPRAGSWQECSELCRNKYAECKFWTLVRGQCLVKNSKDGKRNMKGAISGSRECGSNTGESRNNSSAIEGSGSEGSEDVSSLEAYLKRNVSEDQGSADKDSESKKYESGASGIPGSGNEKSEIEGSGNEGSGSKNEGLGSAERRSESSGDDVEGGKDEDTGENEEDKESNEDIKNHSGYKDVSSFHHIGSASGDIVSGDEESAIGESLESYSGSEVSEGEGSGIPESVEGDSGTEVPVGEIQKSVAEIHKSLGLIQKSVGVIEKSVDGDSRSEVSVDNIQKSVDKITTSVGKIEKSVDAEGSVGEGSGIQEPVKKGNVRGASVDEGSEIQESVEGGSGSEVSVGKGSGTEESVDGHSVNEATTNSGDGIPGAEPENTMVNGEDKGENENITLKEDNDDTAIESGYKDIHAFKRILTDSDKAIASGYKDIHEFKDILTGSGNKDIESIADNTEGSFGSGSYESENESPESGGSQVKTPEIQGSGGGASGGDVNPAFLEKPETTEPTTHPEKEDVSQGFMEKTGTPGPTTQPEKGDVNPPFLEKVETTEPTAYPETGDVPLASLEKEKLDATAEPTAQPEKGMARCGGKDVKTCSECEKGKCDDDCFEMNGKCDFSTDVIGCYEEEMGMLFRDMDSWTNPKTKDICSCNRDQGGKVSKHCVPGYTRRLLHGN